MKTMDSSPQKHMYIQKLADSFTPAEVYEP